MLLIHNKILVKLLTFNFGNAIALFPFVFVKFESYKTNRTIINHEKIHLRQQLELGLFFFYIIYFSEFLIKYIKYGSRETAYYNISFERESYHNENDYDYLKKRKFWAFLNYYQN